MSKSLRKEIRCFDTRQTVIRLEDARLPGSAAGFSPAGGENRRQCWQPGRAVINLCFPAVSGRPGHSSPHTALSTVQPHSLLCTPANQANVANPVSLLVVSHPTVVKPSSTLFLHYQLGRYCCCGRVAGRGAWLLSL